MIAPYLSIISPFYDQREKEEHIGFQP